MTPAAACHTASLCWHLVIQLALITPGGNSRTSNGRSAISKDSKNVAFPCVPVMLLRQHNPLSSYLDGPPQALMLIMRTFLVLFCRVLWNLLAD